MAEGDTNGSPPFVYISNRQIFEKLQHVEISVDRIVEADLPRRVAVLERWKTGSTAVGAVAIAIAPYVIWVLTKGK